MISRKAQLLCSIGDRCIDHTGKILDFPLHFCRTVGAAEIFQKINGFFHAVIRHGAGAVNQTLTANIAILGMRVAKLTGTIGSVNGF